MNEEEFLKAIRSSKEDLIEWLNDMYKDQNEMKSIIGQYENMCNAKIEEKMIENPENNICYMAYEVSAKVGDKTINYRRFKND